MQLHAINLFIQETYGAPTVTEKEFPGWVKFIIAMFLLVPIVPIFYYLIRDLLRNPTAWKNAFKECMVGCMDSRPPERIQNRTRVPSEGTASEMQTDQILLKKIIFIRKNL